MYKLKLILFLLIVSFFYSSVIAQEDDLIFSINGIGTRDIDAIEYPSNERDDTIAIPNGPTILKDVTRKMKSPGYWISKLRNPDKVILSPQEIDTKNKNLMRKTINLNNISNYPATVRTSILKKQEKQILRLFTCRTYIDDNFDVIPKSEINKIDKQIAIPSGKYINVKYAITTSYGNVRLLPTDKTFLYDKLTFDIDRLQVASLDIGEPIIALHQTKNKQWTYIISLTAEGWIKTQNIAFTDKQKLNSWISPTNFIIITDTKSDIYLNQEMTDYYDFVRMSTKLPIIKNINKDIICVSIPQRTTKGNLILKKGYLYSNTVNKNYLKYTQRNVLLQAFKHLNSPYSWGGLDGEQDCSTFVRQVFGCFGMILPRNSMAQIYAGTKLKTLSRNVSDEEKSKEIINNTTSAISLLYLPGHIMIYIGAENNKPYIIHAIWGSESHTAKKEATVSFINKIVVSSLMIGMNTTKGSLLKRISKVNTLTLDKK